MKFKKRTKVHVNLESVALTDIVMNLFLFFFITFTLYSTFQFSRHSPIKIKLPSVQKGEAINETALSKIQLSKSGDLYWDGERVTPDQLKTKLIEAKNGPKQVTLDADREASVQMLIGVLDLIRTVGANNVNLQTELKSAISRLPDQNVH